MEARRRGRGNLRFGGKIVQFSRWPLQRVRLPGAAAAVYMLRPDPLLPFLVDL